MVWHSAYFYIRRFLVVMDSRETSDSRLLDLLDTFCLKDRVIITGEEFDVCDLKDIDWNRVDNIYIIRCLRYPNDI